MNKIEKCRIQEEIKDLIKIRDEMDAVQGWETLDIPEFDAFIRKRSMINHKIEYRETLLNETKIRYAQNRAYAGL